MAEKNNMIKFADKTKMSQKLTYCQHRGGVTTKSIKLDTTIIFDFLHRKMVFSIPVFSMLFAFEQKA